MGMSAKSRHVIGEKKNKLHFFRDAQSFPAGGLGGKYAPQRGQGGAPEANAYWQHSTENCRIII